jgi:hypothetical protein
MLCRAPWIVAMGSVFVACATSGVSSAGSARVQPVAVSLLQGAVIAPGSILRARLEQPIDTATSKPGDRFAAVVVASLHTPSDDVMVPEGARLYGHVGAIAHGTRARIQLAFDRIETVDGTSTIAATLRHAASVSYRGAPVPRMVPTSSGFGFNAFDSGFFSDNLAPMGGGPVGWDVMQYPPRELRLPKGSEVLLTLTEPLLPPAR